MFSQSEERWNFLPHDESTSEVISASSPPCISGLCLLWFTGMQADGFGMLSSDSNSILKAKFCEPCFCLAFHFNPNFFFAPSNLSCSHCLKCSLDIRARAAVRIGSGLEVIFTATAWVGGKFSFHCCCGGSCWNTGGTIWGETEEVICIKLGISF